MIRFTTESGSKYEINPRTKIWKRTDKTAQSGQIRDDSGTLIEIPFVKVGYPVLMRDTNILPGYVAHVVHTSRVVSIEENER